MACVQQRGSNLVLGTNCPYEAFIPKGLARQALDENEFVTRPKSLNVYRFVVLFKAGRSYCPAFCWKVGKVYYDKFLHVAE